MEVKAIAMMAFPHNSDRGLKEVTVEQGGYKGRGERVDALSPAEEDCRNEGASTKIWLILGKRSDQISLLLWTKAMTFCPIALKETVKEKVTGATEAEDPLINGSEEIPSNNNST